MVKRSTWVMVVLLALVAGLAYYMQTVPNNIIQKAMTARNTPTEPPLGTLIAAADGPLNGINIVSADGHSVTIKREPSGWTFAIDTQSLTEADQAAAEQAASQAQGLRLISGEITPSTSDLSAFGLDKPAYTYRLVLSNDKTVTFKIGKATVTDNGYYLQKEDGTIVAVDKYMMDTLLDLLKQPPYKVSPTPSPTPATALPTGTITPTPTPGT
ncbi:MAG: DUF4340 domain-containing protein [Anaerolineales bacterium]